MRFIDGFVPVEVILILYRLIFKLKIYTLIPESNQQYYKFKNLDGKMGWCRGRSILPS